MITFDAVKDVELPSFLEQLKQKHPIRRQIDTLVLEIIGFERERIDELLGDLYPALANEIEKLKTLMAG